MAKNITHCTFKYIPQKKTYQKKKDLFLNKVNTKSIQMSCLYL